MKSMSPTPSPPLLHCHSPPLFAIPQEYSKKTEEEDELGTPLHHPSPKRTTMKRPESAGSISSKCRPHVREKFSVVPLDKNGSPKQLLSMASPNGILKSMVSSFTRKSPKSITNKGTDWAEREEHWKTALAEVSHKLIQATRKRDEALLEASRLKYSMAELEKKLNKLEIYCHSLKPGLDLISDKIIKNFLTSVSESRSWMRQLSRTVAIQLRQMGGKIYDRIQISKSRPTTSLSIHLEAILNRAFFEDFESIGFAKNSSNVVLNPSDRAESNIAWFNRLHGLSWEEVLSKGTRHFSEEFSRFCDRKMSDIVAMLEWNRAWPEPVLQAFFAAAKSVWLVHLLANAVHPSLPIFRVESGLRFDAVYMEDITATELASATVTIMLSPGFYVFRDLIKCKVLCKYHTNLNN